MRQATERPWAAIRRDFEAGATYRALVEKYGAYDNYYRKRARKEKWAGVNNRYKKYGSRALNGSSTALNGSSAAPNGSMTKRSPAKKTTRGHAQTPVTVAIGGNHKLHLLAASISLDKEGLTIRL